MKVRLTKPLPQIAAGVFKVLPAGVVIDDAPEAFMEKLVKQGRAEVWDGVVLPDPPTIDDLLKAMGEESEKPEEEAPEEAVDEPEDESDEESEEPEEERKPRATRRRVR